MKYIAKKPNTDINTQKTSMLLQAMKLLGLLLIAAVIFYFVLRIILYVIIDHLPPSFETKLMANMPTTFTEGAKESDYLDHIIEKLAPCADLPYEIKAYITPETTPNAFALPGGTIYVTRGMLDTLKNENELVSILGHEMGHFKHKHHLKALGTSLIFGIMVATLGEGYGDLLATTLNISQIKYSQSAELESDIFGLDVMACAYGSVTDATKPFERMDDHQHWQYFFETHPAFDDRIANMQRHIKSKGYDTTASPIAFEAF